MFISLLKWRHSVFQNRQYRKYSKKVLEYDGSILYPKTLNEKFGFAVAEIEDSEGNRIALHQDL